MMFRSHVTPKHFLPNCTISTHTVNMNEGEKKKKREVERGGSGLITMLHVRGDDRFFGFKTSSMNGKTFRRRRFKL